MKKRNRYIILVISLAIPQTIYLMEDNCSPTESSSSSSSFNKGGSSSSTPGLTFEKVKKLLAEKRGEMRKSHSLLELPESSQPDAMDKKGGSERVTVIVIPRMTFEDPQDPHHSFVVSTSSTALPDRELPECNHHHSGRPFDDRSDDANHGGQFGNNGINYDQIYRFRNYPLVALLILSFDRYPKTTLVTVGLATVITIWKYKNIVDFLEKAKEKAMGLELRPSQVTHSQQHEKIIKRMPWLEKVKQKICSW
ncbi:MAG: hypothetical protein Q8Q25_00770 [bacterium]|nr:hypothetical protein [bacterium]